MLPCSGLNVTFADMTLYLKYRPQKISDLDIVSVRETLEKLVKSQNLPHAFLLAGPKGVGKTSTARIIAKVVNCEKNDKKLGEPCNKCTSCKEILSGASIDVIELDAASNRGIDDIRVIRDSVKLAPARSRKKIYIIDEAHMLTTEASNALLKTLEEPPKHVMFMLATTNPEKLLSTIRSRTTLISYHEASLEELVSSLKKITKGERIKVNIESLRLIAEASDGSFRDAAKIIEQIVNERISFKKESLAKFLGASSVGNVVDIIKKIEEGNLSEVISKVEEVSQQGEDFVRTLENFIKEVHGLIVENSISGKNKAVVREDRLIELSDLLLEANEKMKLSPIAQLPLEIAFIKWSKLNGKEAESKEEIERDNTTKKKEEDLVQNNNDKKGSGFKKDVKTNGDLEISSKSVESLRESFDNSAWTKVLGAVRNINTSIEALLRATKPLEFDGKVLKLGVFYKFHKEKLEENKNRMILEEVVQKVLAVPAKIECVLTQIPSTNPVPKKTTAVLKEPIGQDEDIIKVAKQIFES